jgi:dienelactone hydrolase
MISENVTFKLEELTFHPDKGKNISAFFATPRLGKRPWPVILYFHRAIESGNAVLSIAEDLAVKGIAVLGFDAPGYGKRKDEMVIREWKDILLGRMKWISEGMSAVALLGQLPETKDSPIIVMGASLGAHAAVVLCGVVDEVDGTVLVVGGAGKFDAMLEQAQKMGGISEDEMNCIRELDPRRAASRITSPVLMINGRNDRIIPEEEVQTLYDILTGEKKIHWIEEDHRFPVRKITPVVSRWLERMEFGKAETE